MEKCLLLFQNVGVVLRPPTPQLCHRHLRQELSAQSTQQKTFCHMDNFLAERVDQLFLCHVYRRGGDGENVDCRSHWPMGDWGLVGVLPVLHDLDLVLL